MLVDIPHGHGKGHWVRCLVDEYGDNPRWSAMVRCPDCGKVLFARDHKIDDNGQITPSLGHPVEYPPCGWYTSPRLVGWAPVPPTPGPLPTHDCARCGAKGRQLGGWGTWPDGSRLVCPTCIANGAYG